MPTPLKDIIAELQFLTDRISTQARTVSVSVIALVWVLLNSVTPEGLGLGIAQRRHLLIAGTLALATMVCDFLQYFFGFLYTNALRKEVEEADCQVGDYDYSDWRYRVRQALFWAKQALLVAAVIWLGMVLVPVATAGLTGTG